MINGKDQEIITINKTGNSILNNAKYSADNTDEWKEICLNIWTVILYHIQFYVTIFLKMQFMS